MEQITLNFDASEFESYESTQEFFNRMTHKIRDAEGKPIKACVQAMEMDYSPSQWSHKCNQSNNTSLTLNDADKHTDIYGDVSWIFFAIHKHIIKKKNNKEDLLRAREEINRKLKEMDE